MTSLLEPWQVKDLSGNPFQVFTLFWNACRKLPLPPLPEETPCRIAAPDRWPDSLGLAELQLLPSLDRAEGLRESWCPGQPGAAAELCRFLEEPLVQYHSDRDLPAAKETSRLSPHLHFGEISARQVWHAVCSRAVSRTVPIALKGSEAYLRELWRTGWTHNRVRMIVASFLVKDLHLHRLESARWFWDTQVDADLANNTLGWQWTAGCGPMQPRTSESSAR